MSIDNIKKLKGAIVKKGRTKSKSKAIGIKSTFVTEKGVAISSVAESVTPSGVKAPNIEMYSSHTGDEVYKTHYRMLRSASVSPDVISIDGLFDSIEIFNPAKNGGGSDYIGIKSELEKKYFGKEMNRDNIHVQIAYNIADIKKHIMLFINQIIYTFYNINRTTTEFDRYIDLIGTLYVFADMQRQEQQKDLSNVRELLRGVYFYDAYFPEIFKIAKVKGDGTIEQSERDRCDSYNYNILRLISAIRQACEHEKLGPRYADELLYNIEGMLSSSPELLRILDDFYSRIPKKVNKNFDTTSKNNLYILSKIFPSLSREALVEKYYRYSVLKEQSNLGVNLKLTREIIIDTYITELRDKKYDTFRSKLYTAIGFSLVQWLSGTQLLSDTVAKLRANTGDEGRIKIYLDLAQSIWDSYGENIRHIVSEFDKEAQNKFKSSLATDIKAESMSCALGRDNFSYFAKLILFMTKFLDGKEINELLTGLISRFSNISDLVLSAESCGVEISFRDEYRFFKSAQLISNQLRIVQSIAKLKLSNASVKSCMLIDAVNILGINQPILCANECTDEDQLAVNRSFLDRLYGTNETQKPNHQLRNFLINNVVSSRWFMYIARYTKPSVCSKLMSNAMLVRFILKELPDEQIDRYYKSVSGGKFTKEDKRKYLFERIHKFSIDKILDDVESMNKRDYISQREGSEKQKNCALVGLYLTMVYLAVKSLVKVNAVYSIAFSCLERDIALKAFDSKDLLSVSKEMIDKDSSLVLEYNRIRDSIRDNESLTKEEKRREYKALLPILKKMHYTLHGYYCVRSNLDIASSLSNTEVGLFKLYRNCIAHLSIAVEFPRYLEKMKSIDSYFSIFAFCLQSHIVKALKSQRLAPFSNDELASFIDTQSAFLSRNGRYSRDMLWILNTPFAYNMARYKNLSIEDLFYGRASNDEPVQVSKDTVPKQAVSIDDIKIGDTVTMTRTEATMRGGLRGFIIDSDIKITLSPKSLNGVSPKSLEGKELSVEVVGWDTNAVAFNARLK